MTDRIEDLHHWNYIRRWLWGQASEIGVPDDQIDDAVQAAIADYLGAVETGRRCIQHPLGYMRRCIQHRRAKEARHAAVVDRHEARVRASVRDWAESSTE